MARARVPAGAGRGATGASSGRRSPPPPRPAAPVVGSPGVGALVAGMANARLVDRPAPVFQPFNFDASFCSILALTETMRTSGRQNTIGTFLIPNVRETDVNVHVSVDGWYAELSLRVPPMFLYLIDRFDQEMASNDPDAPIVQAGLRAVENQILHQYPDRENVRTNVHRVRLPYTCCQNPLISFLYLDDGLAAGMTTVLRVTFESQDRVRTTSNYGTNQVIIRNNRVPPAQGLGGALAGGGGGALAGGAAAAGGGFGGAGGGGAAVAGGVAAAAGGGGGVPLGGNNPINNGLFAAEVQRQARDAARRQQQLDQGHRGH